MATNLLDLMGYMQGQVDAGKAEGRQSKLAQLASQAYAAPQPQRQGLVQQAIGVDPQSGFALDKSLQGGDDARMERVGQMAGMLVSMPAQARPQAYSGIVRELHSIGLGDGLPDQWSDELLPYAQKLASAAGRGDEMKSLTKGANGNYWAIKNGQYVDTGVPFNPETAVRDQPGVPFDILNKRTGGSIYDQQAPQLTPNSAYQTPSGIVKIGDVAPEDMAAVQADILANGASDSYALPPRDVSPGAQGRPPMRPAVSPAQQQQMELARQAAQRAQEANQRAAEAARRASLGNAPTGQRFRPDGTLEDIPGAHLPAKPPSQAELTAKGYFDRMKAAEDDLQATVAAGYDAGNYRDYATAGQGPALNWLASDLGQQYRQKQEDWVRAKLRKESGAVIGDDEMEREIKTYFPQPGDGANVIRKKEESRKIAIEAMRQAANRANNMGASQGRQPTQGDSVLRYNPATGDFE